MNIQQIKRAAEIAKARTTDKRWVAAINKAVAGLLSGEIIVTELVGGSLVTTENGSYMTGKSCQCRAAEFGQPCRHRAAVRLVELSEAPPEPTKAPRIVRSVETDRTRQRYTVVRCDGWAI